MKIYRETSRTRIHPVLSDTHQTPLTYDLSLPPSTSAVTDLKFSKVELDVYKQPATAPGLPYLEITHPQLQWKLAVRPTVSGGTVVTVADVLTAIHTGLRTSITAAEFQVAGGDHTDPRRQQRISAAYRARCDCFKGDAKQKELRKGVKRIDFLEGVRMFAGLVSTKDGAHVWRLRTTA